MAAEVFGGGRVALVDAAIDIKLELHDAAGVPMAPAAGVGGERVALTLPHLPVAEPGAEFHWLHEVFEGAEFLGYAWAPDEAVDLDAGTVTFTLPVAALQGTVFLRPRSRRAGCRITTPWCTPGAARRRRRETSATPGPSGRPSPWWPPNCRPACSCTARW